MGKILCNRWVLLDEGKRMEKKSEKPSAHVRRHHVTVYNGHEMPIAMAMLDARGIDDARDQSVRIAQIVGGLRCVIRVGGVWVQRFAVGADGAQGVENNEDLL